MKRALWSMPLGLVAWYALGFGTWYLGSAGDGLVPLSAGSVDVTLLGGLTGGIAAGMVVRRLRLALPLVVPAVAGAWWIAPKDATAPSGSQLAGALITLLVASMLGALLGVAGGRRSVLAGTVLALPTAWYVTRTGDLAGRPAWAVELDGLLIAIGFAMLLYVACWQEGWRALGWWPVVAVAYLSSFSLVAAVNWVATILGSGARADLDRVTEAAMDAFAGAFGPFLRTYWGWLSVAAFLGVMIVALKIRVLPPAPRPIAFDDGSNDAFLPDDLGWFDHEEPPPRRLFSRGPPEWSTDSGR